MNKPSNYSAAGTVVYGLFIIVPVAVVFLLLVKLTEILEKVAAPLGLESSFGAAIVLLIAIVIAVLMVLSFSWIVGSIMRRAVSYEKFEATILNQIPGYQIIAKVAKGFSEGEVSYPPALIELHGPGAAVLGFVMEEHDNGQVTVFVPSTPVLTMGNIYLVERERITPLKASAADVADCISQWGMGSRKIVAGAVDSPTTKIDS
jgi:uncharacterized membrane protein